MASRPLVDGRFFLRRCRQSATLWLLCLVSLAAALPVLVYLHFDHKDARRTGQAYGALADRDRQVAAALAPTLAVSSNPSDEAVTDALARSAATDSRRWLLFIPADAALTAGIRVTALEPSIGSTNTDGALNDVTSLKIVRELPTSCLPTGNSGTGNIMVSTGSRFTSIVSIPSMRGCWLLISEGSQTTSPSPFANPLLLRLWDARLLIAAYVLIMGAAILSAIMISVGLRRFRTIAYDIGQYRMPLGNRIGGKVMPELAGAAEVLDGLALDIRRTSNLIRQTAEDNAHSLKTPLAVVRAAIGRIRRHLPDEPDAAQPEAVHYALAAADQAVDRLFLLITSAQRLDEDTAALIVAPRQLINFTELIEETARQFANLIAARRIQCVLKLPAGVMVRAGIGHLETVVRNVVDNAIDSLPDGGVLVLSLTRGSHKIHLRVEDNGEGVAPDAVDRLFERDYSTPDSEVDESDISPRHVRPGLFIVRRNVEALGGRVAAENIPIGGFAITITLPRPRR